MNWLLVLVAAFIIVAFIYYQSSLNALNAFGLGPETLDEILARTETASAQNAVDQGSQDPVMKEAEKSELRTIMSKIVLKNSYEAESPASDSGLTDAASGMIDRAMQLASGLTNSFGQRELPRMQNVSTCAVSRPTPACATVLRVAGEYALADDLGAFTRESRFLGNLASCLGVRKPAECTAWMPCAKAIMASSPVFTTDDIMTDSDLAAIQSSALVRNLGFGGTQCALSNMAASPTPRKEDVCTMAAEMNAFQQQLFGRTFGALSSMKDFCASDETFDMYLAENVGPK